MDINDFDDDDLLKDDEPQLDTSEIEEDDGGGWIQANLDGDEVDEDNDLSTEVDVVAEILKDNGISDPEHIKFEDENGYIQDRAWDDLSSIELLNILRSNKVIPEEGLDDEEIEFINLLRANGLTPNLYQELLNLLIQAQLLEISQNAYNQGLLENLEPSFTSDQLSDDELFILDLQSRVPDITDEELEEALLQAKNNSDLYVKLMNGIRAEYQRLESENWLREEAIQLQLQQEEYNQYSGIVLNEINNLQNIGDLDISMNDDEMNELAEFILSSDSLGVNHFSKALLDPQTLVQMAWFALHGEEMLNGISDYYNGELQKVSKAAYDQGVTNAFAYISNNLNNPEVVYLPSKKQDINKPTSYRSIEDLDD